MKIFCRQKDRMIQQELYMLLFQLQDIAPHDAVKYLFEEVRKVK
jgi:hypothetical protein